ncbi:unnamed protein product [Ixodes hexagonus]
MSTTVDEPFVSSCPCFHLNGAIDTRRVLKTWRRAGMFSCNATRSIDPWYWLTMDRSECSIAKPRHLHCTSMAVVRQSQLTASSQRT